MNQINENSPIPAQLIALIQREGFSKGCHLPAQMLADHLGISRQPINEALAVLQQKGVVVHKPNKGYFLNQEVTDLYSSEINKLGLDTTDHITKIYFQIAEDRLKDLLPDEFSEQLIKHRYDLTNTQLNTVLGRIAQEGWAERKSGYGWRFSAMLTTPESLLQSYRLRLALEPAALLEPNYKLCPEVLRRCRTAELELLKNGIETATIDQLHNRGVYYHESLVEASGNVFFIDTIKRVNRVRRLLSYRSMRDRQRYKEHCKQHLYILELLEKEHNKEASEMLEQHLQHTLNELSKIEHVFKR